MSWTFNGTRVYVQKFETGNKQIIARLQPIDNNTTLHFFGYESEILKVGGLVATQSGMDNLVALMSTATSYSLVGPEGTVGNYFVNMVVGKRTEHTNSKFFDQPTLDCDIPVYQVDMELYIDG